MALSLESSWQEHVTEQTTYLMIWEANERYREEILSQKKKGKEKPVTFRDMISMTS